MSLERFVTVCLPYCLDRQPDGTYVALNREYKPIGFCTREVIKYEDYPVCLRLMGIGPVKAAELSYKGKPDTERIYLYNDGCDPRKGPEYWKKYADRLKKIAKLRVRGYSEKSPVRIIPYKAKQF